jgi:putative peptide zinc metalloprotease protein
MAEVAHHPTDAPPDAALCPRAVSNLQAWVLYEKPDEDLYCVGDLERDRFIAVPDSKVDIVLDVAAHFDGEHSLVWIQDYYREEYAQEIDVARLYHLLSQANLIAEPAPENVFQGEFRRFSVDLLDIPTRGFFENLQPLAKRIYTPLLIFTLLGMIAGLWSFQPALLTSRAVYQVGDSFALGYAVLSLVSLLSLGIHECAHAVIAAAHGAVTRHVKLALYMGFIPYIYTEIAGIYTLPPADRLRIWSAGCYANALIGSLGLLTYRVIAPHVSLIAGQVILKIALANFLMILGNLSPLLPTDGYFIVSTLLKKVNVRTNAFRAFFKWLKGEQNKLKGFTLLYFTASSLALLQIFALQVRWFVYIYGELRARQLPLVFVLGILGLLLAARILIPVLFKRRTSTKRALPHRPSIGE